MSQEIERELGWDDEIEKDGGDFILLPEGDYMFTVSKFERGRFAGSAKMPPCNQAKLELTVHSPEHGDVVIFHNLLLHTKTEGLLSNFFTGIGQKKKGEKLRMNWNAVIGAKGKLQLEVNKFIGRDGEERTNNQVKKFYPFDEAFPQGIAQGYQQPVQQPTQQQAPFPTGNQQQGGFTPGQF
ncbi:hypothetical protein JOD43_002144 [Pullulanibacillus pueri]|uniref:DUF669 domain-containing protein n=1 Tax=Pullulanibacillus pueri TaxID=1437324 RepID=A0A8J2ZX56_9BACL|nr:hypothetical protein [Pullulanibacillus pueri]MBM7681972.1 hypothetical protein [Pullulanibacillus pueri]GGH83632.1 hypothetical protein GCM10007096_24830 [Pullulanibacillus pueri]